MPEVLTVAVCIADEVFLSDFVTPMEIIGFLNTADRPEFAPLFGEVPYRVKIDYVAPTLEPVTAFLGSTSPKVVPTMTYKSAKENGVQFDILWVPAGNTPDFKTGEDNTHKDQIEFIKLQSPGAKYVCAVCGGSAILAFAGVLSGKRATTNKALFRMIETYTPKDIAWVQKARWVVDGKYWTSSGVTAGEDMALALLDHLVGPETARHIRGQVEVIETKQDEDPFAEFHGLV